MTAMQKLLRACNILAIGLLLSLQSRAGGDVTKEKSYSKTYDLSATDRVSISNKFGKVDVHTWDKSQVKVDVHITATSGSEQGATTVLDRIHIQDSKDGSLVRFKTDLDQDDENDDRKDHEHNHEHNRKFSIDYTVYLPAAQTLELNNDFGATTLPDYSGLLEVTSKFGSLDAGRLGSVKRLNVEFGKTNIGAVNAADEAELVIKFSKADISEVSGRINADFEFCDVMELKAGSGIKGLKIKNAYTHLNLSLPSGLPANFSIDTHFGTLNNHSDFAIKKEADDDGFRFTEHYAGKSGDGSVDIRVKDEFATIDIR
jgi:hypothetical protein